MSKLNIDDVENARLEGEARAMIFMEKWKREFFAPVGLRAIRELIRTMTPQQLGVLQENAPESYDKVIEMIGGNDG